MFLNKNINNLGIKKRITLTFGLVFIFITSITTISLYFILNTQNLREMNEIFIPKINDINIYYNKLENYIEKYNEKKLKLSFEPEIINQKLVYDKPFDEGQEDFKYVLHIVSPKNNVDSIPLNTTGYKVSLKELEYVRDDKISEIMLQEKNKYNYYSVLKSSRKIRGVKFDIYIFKDNTNHKALLNLLKNIFIISIILGLILIFVLSNIISNGILVPIKNIIKTSKEISKGNLKKRIKPLNTHDELMDLTNIINEMLDKINLSFEKQSRFISDASHELRTPITILKGYAELISRRYIKNMQENEKNTPRNEMLIEAINAIINESDNMNKLISSLLFLSRNETDEYDKSNRILISSSDILNQIKKDYDLIDVSNKIIIDKNENFDFITDKNLLLQSIRIVLENSIKYSPVGTNIYLSSTTDEDYGYISIRDEGYGMDGKELERIFDRFYRIDESRNKNTGGHGLGLSIFKKILEIQGHKFTIESKINIGTRITIIIEKNDGNI